MSRPAMIGTMNARVREENLFLICAAATIRIRFHDEFQLYSLGDLGGTSGVRDSLRGSNPLREFATDKTAVLSLRVSQSMHEKD